jgi:uncharacterized membrane protein YkgB
MALTSPAADHPYRGGMTQPSTGVSIAGYGTTLLRIGLGLVLLLIGGLKFTSDEATAIQLFISHSPFISWLNLLLAPQAVSNLLGTLEIATGLLILSRPLSAKASAVGSAMAIGTFMCTVSFLFTTPGVWSAHYGFPALGDVGAFLIKDVTLLGAAVYTLGEALSHISTARNKENIYAAG